MYFYISIIFLIYLGVKSITNKKKLDFDQKNLKGGMTSFFQGLSISILNPKILIWFIAIYSQFMSVDNNIIFNTLLILIAGLVDAFWYITLTYIVTSNIALDYIKSKSVFLHRLVGGVFILIGIILLLKAIA